MAEDRRAPEGAQHFRAERQSPQGYTDFFNGTIDARPVLQSYSYGEQAMYVDTIEENGMSHALVTDIRLEEAKLRLVGDISGNVNRAAATVRVTEDHTRGHFKILPGHKRVGMAIAVARDRYEAKHPGKTLELISIGTANFGKLVATGDTIDVDVERDGDVYGAAITSSREVAASIAGMRFREIDRVDKDALTPNQLIEMGAQAAGLSTGEFKLGQRGRLPMFNSFGDADFYRMPEKGEALIIKPDVKVEGDLMTGSFRIYSGEELIARVGSLEAKMWPSRAIRMMIGNLLRKSVQEGDIQ